METVHRTGKNQKFKNLKEKKSGSAQPSKYSKKICKRENRLLDYRDATRPSARAILTEWEAQRPKASEANEQPETSSDA